MNKKRIVQLSAFVVAIVAFIFIFQMVSYTPSQPTSYVQGADPVPKHKTIVVNGVGEVTVKPDMATIHIGAQSVATSAEKAQANVSERMKIVQKKLKEYNINKDQMKTISFNVYPHHGMNADGTPNEQEQFRAEHLLEIEFKEIDRLGELLDTATKAGANHISYIEFGLQNQTEAEHKALQDAIVKTKEKANVMAKSVGKKSGDVIHIADQAAQFHLPQSESFHMANSATAEESAAHIEAGEVKIIQRVDVVYELN